MSITVNGVEITDQDVERELPFHAAAEAPLRSAAQALVLRHVLLQEAERLGLAATAADADSRAEALIERLIAQEVRVPEPTEAECRTYYGNHPERFRSGDLVEASHILFQINEGSPLALIRARANEVLQEVLAQPDRFGELARRYSNCPSGAAGGNLGQLSRGQSVPEFEAVVFRMRGGEIRSRLLETRFGLHIVKVERRIDGVQLPFEAVRERIAGYMSEAARRRAIHQYLQILVGQAEIHGIELTGAETPLVQ